MGFLGSIFNSLARIPGTPEANTAGLLGAARGKYGWNPYGRNSALDVSAWGTSLSENPNIRGVGRAVGTAAAAYFGAGALSAEGAGAGEAVTSADLASWTPTGSAPEAATAADWSGAVAPAGSDPSGEGLAPYHDPVYDPGGGQGTAGPMDGGPSGSSFYDQMRQRLMGMSGRQWGRLGMGLYGFGRALQSRREQRPPSSQEWLNSPGYKAGLDAVQASMAAQGYTGGSNAAARVAEYGSAGYSNYAAMQQRSAAMRSDNTMSELGSLGLIASGFGW